MQQRLSWRKMKSWLRSNEGASRDCSLEQVLQYRNSDLIDRFLVEVRLSRAEAEEVFTELMKWIWLCSQFKRDQALGVPGVPKSLTLYTEITVIDEMWHTFILFTREYTRFCRSHFDCFIHHLPVSEAEKAEEQMARQKAPEQRREEQRERLTTDYAYVYDKLGKATLDRWYVEYPERYSKRRIDRAKIEALQAKDRGCAHAAGTSCPEHADGAKKAESA